MATVVQESELVSFFIYNPLLGPKEGQEHQKLLYYWPESEILNRKVRNMGLCEAMVNFTRTFNPDKPCEVVHTQRKRQVFYEAEPNIWMVLTVSVPWAEVINNGEKSVEYYEHHVQDPLIEAALLRSYNMFKLFNGCYGNITKQFGIDGLKRRLERFYSRYLSSVDFSKLDIFSVLQGVQFLPLDKYMYLKIHCFVNLVETTFRNIQRTMFLFADQLVWSGLEQEDTKIFYQYYLSWLLPSHLGGADPLSSLSLSMQSMVVSGPAAPPQGRTGVAPASTQSSQGSFLIGEEAAAGAESGLGKSPWVYVNMDGILQSCKLFVYTNGSATLCLFVQTDKGSPTQDFCKRLSTFLGPRIGQVSREITDFQKTRQPSLELQYRFVYFNEMNLAVKSPLLSRRPPYVTITPDAMRLITEVNKEYDRVEEGETIMRTMTDYWVVCRKSGHRRFFVVLQQKSANFAEVNEEVRRLCQKEFTNIFFLD